MGQERGLGERPGVSGRTDVRGRARSVSPKVGVTPREATAVALGAGGLVGGGVGVEAGGPASPRLRARPAAAPQPGVCPARPGHEFPTRTSHTS